MSHFEEIFGRPGRRRNEVSDHASQVVNPLDKFGSSLLVILSLHIISHD